MGVVDGGGDVRGQEPVLLADVRGDGEVDDAAVAAESGAHAAVGGRAHDAPRREGAAGVGEGGLDAWAGEEGGGGWHSGKGSCLKVGSA